MLNKREESNGLLLLLLLLSWICPLHNGVLGKHIGYMAV